MSKQIVLTRWFDDLADECKTVMTESVFTSRWVLIEAYHQIGEAIREHEKKMPVTELVRSLSDRLEVSERKLWQAVQFYDKFPDINKLPDGKNITWSRVRKLLAAPKDEAPHECSDFISLKICKNCGKRKK